MSQPRFRLRTLDQPSLHARDGAVTFEDPRAYALLVLLALAGDEGVEESLLLLRLTPELTPARGRGALRFLRETLERTLGEGTVLQSDARTRLAPGIVTLDVWRPDSPAHPAGLRFLRGFSLPDSPEFVEWLDAERCCVAPLQPAARRRPIFMALGGGLAFLAAGLWWAARASPAPSFTPGTLVVLADVDNATGDTLFDAGLTVAAAVALEQSGHMGLLPKNRIREALTRAGVPSSDSSLGLERAREAAAREGVRFVIAPRIALEGTGYRVSAVLLDAQSDELVKEASTVAEGPAGVIPALDRVLREVRVTLGEASARGAEAEPLPRVVTPSLEALRSYALGTKAWREGDYELAEQLWQRALALDSSFAMALSSIARSKALGHHRDSARYYSDRALAHAARMSEWERLRLQESRASDRGDRDSAVKLAGIIAERFPTSVNVYNYGTALLQAGRCGEAVAPLERSLALDSMSYSAHINLATCARRAGEFPSAVHHYERAAAIFPAVIVRGNQGYEFAGLLARIGLIDSAERQFGRMAEQTGMFDRALGYRGLAFLALQQGQTAEAVRNFEATLEIFKQQRAQLSLVRGYLFIGVTHAMTGDAGAADLAFREMMRIIRTSPIVPSMLALAGWGLVRAERVADAETVLVRLRQQSNGSADDRGAAAMLQGAIALSRGQFELADSLLRAGPAFVQPDLADMLRAEALEQVGKPDSAAKLRSSVSGATNFGSETHFELIRHQRIASGRTPTGRR